MYEGLEEYLPNKEAFDWITKWLNPSPIRLEITNNRQTKLGDFRHRAGSGLKITINGDLDKELFFFVLSHEIAHYKVFLDHYPKRILPHGVEWKKKFGEMLNLSLEAYSEDLQSIIQKHAKNPKANFYSDSDLSGYFIKESTPLLQDLEEGSRFRVKNKWFRKGEKRRIKYICTEIKSGRQFIFHPLTPIDSSK